MDWGQSARRVDQKIFCILTFNLTLTSPAGPSTETGEVSAQREWSAEGDSKASIRLLPPRLAYLRTAVAADIGLPANEQSMPGTDVARSLSRRELVILRTLTEGASNKIIAQISAERVDIEGGGGKPKWIEAICCR